MKKITPAQQKILDYVISKTTTRMEDLNDKFHAKALKNLLEAGVLVREWKSRLRQDDMEMVYWSEVRLKNDSDVIREMIKS
jgi:TRAP-type C4-dicarboxylate transport system substrate-binding protein